MIIPGILFSQIKEILTMKSFYMGVDVSKGYADFVIIDSQKRPVIKNFQLDDTFDGHNNLYDILSRFLKDNQAILYAAVESTGGYENNWYKTLLGFQTSLNIQTARLNPSGVAYNSKADLKRNKTDKISAQSVAEYLITHSEKVIYQKEDHLTGLKKQWGFIKMLSKQCTQLLNQLESLLYTANPEILVYCKDGVTAWVLKLLLKYPTAEKLKKANVTTIAKIPYVTLNRAQKLRSNAKKSVASDFDPITAQLISTTVTQIIHLKKIITEQKVMMADQCKEIPDIKLLETFIGIGISSAVGLFIEIGDIARFKSAKKLSSFWGLHPVYKQSGDGSGAFKMSKQGRKNPRKILFTVTLTAINNNPVISELYQYHKQQGRSGMDAIGICMHKIVRIIFGMLKNNTPFDPEIDKANRKRSLQDMTSAPKKTINRRFQEYDFKAPVSRRQCKKRLEQVPSHSIITNTKRGIGQPVPLKDILTDMLEKINKT
jgi:transposase